MTREQMIKHAQRSNYNKIIITPARSGSQLRACIRFSGETGDYQTYTNRENLNPVIIQQLDFGYTVTIHVTQEITL